MVYREILKGDVGFGCDRRPTSLGEAITPAGKSLDWREFHPSFTRAVDGRPRSFVESDRQRLDDCQI
jgi:hypothetical protein